MTHTPFVVSDVGQKLLGRIAKVNPHWLRWNKGNLVNVIFRGLHTYISPSYYKSEFAVPTWNYFAVSVSGKVKLIEEKEGKLDFLDKLTAMHEVEKNLGVSIKAMNDI